MGWETVEHWQARSEIDVYELRLKHVDDPYSQAWRVEWGTVGGSRRGVTFAGDDREARARADLERRKTKTVRVWQRID